MKKYIYLLTIVVILSVFALNVSAEDEIDGYIEKGYVVGGMIPKIRCCEDALKDGVNSAHILDGRVPHSILIEMFTDGGIGTMLKKG